MHSVLSQKKAIKESGNIEISEIVNTEPKLQCKFCLIVIQESYTVYVDV